MNKMTKIAALPVAALLALGLAGCGDDNNKDATTSTVTASDGTTKTVVSKATLESAKNAITAAQKAHPNGKVIGLERSDKDQRWEVTILNPANQLVEVDVDYTGKVTNAKAEVEAPDSDEQQIIRLLADIELPDLGDVIADNTPKGGVIDSVELENRDGTLVWELEYDNKATGKDMLTVWADAASGAELASEAAK
ncbi:hypothetical protein LC603019_00949 [Lawsonella clevelandensis]|uniref:PepSY domain-containing protein n=2 Tax=Lawsonella clevelandensis TaxID=1528099 RepID=A0A5E3ZX42_9ACTN|nr:hypothetical protein LC603019_00949 [Lawsonella clevelandensis]